MAEAQKPLLELQHRKTHITVAAATEDEQNLCFYSKRPETAACVGHLRADFGSTGTAFYSTWFPHHNELRTANFGPELDNVVNALRKQGLLGGMQKMNKVLSTMREAKIGTERREEYALRITSENLVFFLRCIPHTNDYNYYLYAYNKEKLLEIESLMRHRIEVGLPEQCWASLRTVPGLMIIKYGESSYYKADKAGYEHLTDAEAAAFLNETMGITKAQAEAMKSGSLFGWRTPAADPRNYDENGKIIMTRTVKDTRER